MFTPEEERQLNEIAHKQITVRAESFIRSPEYPYEIGGFEILPLTLYRFNLLKFSGNSFILGGPIDETDITQFLFLLRKNQALALKDIALRVVGNEPELTAQILDFIDCAFLDAQESGGEGQGGVAWTSFEYQAVHLLATSYGWAEQDILDMPLNRVFQYINLIQKENNPDYLPLDNYTKAKARMLAEKGKLAHE